MEFRRVVALALVVACVGGARPGLRAPALAAASSRLVPGAPELPAPPALTISGTVFESDARTSVPDVRLRLRNLDNGTIVANTDSDRQGGFSFAVSGHGRYLVEAAGKTGGVVAVSDPVTLVGSAASTQVVLPPARSISTATALILIASSVGLLAWIAARDGTTSPER